jgi:multicomponent Na+:H+ antiporter subunit E
MKNKRKFFDFLIYFISLFGFWIILASKFDFQTIFVGMMISFSVVYYNRKLIVNASEIFKTLTRRLILFLFVLFQLFFDILKANIEIAFVVLHPKLPISPSVTKIDTRLRSDFFKTFLCNAITLTPGTVTLQNKGEEITVHCLTEKAKEGLSDWKIHQMILKLEEE